MDPFFRSNLFICISQRDEGGWGLGRSKIASRQSISKNAMATKEHIDLDKRWLTVSCIML